MIKEKKYEAKTGTFSRTMVKFIFTYANDKQFKYLR